jgi:hypothetical protein
VNGRWGAIFRRRRNSPPDLALAIITSATTGRAGGPSGRILRPKKA